MKANFLSSLTKTALILLTSTSLYAAEETNEHPNLDPINFTFTPSSSYCWDMPSFSLSEYYYLPPDYDTDISSLIILSENENLQGPLFPELMAAIESNDQDQVLQILMNSQVNSESNTPCLTIHDIQLGLLKAIKSENIDIIRIFLKNIELDTFYTNYFFLIAIKTDNSDIISLFLTSPKTCLKLEESNINICFKHIISTSNQDILGFFLNAPESLLPSNACIENRFVGAITANNTDMVYYLLWFPNNHRPCDQLIRHIFLQAIQNNIQETVTLLCNLPHLPLSQESVQRIWAIATRSNNSKKLDILRFLLNNPRPEREPQLPIHDRNQALFYAANQGQTDLLTFLLNLPEGQRPAQYAIDRAYRDARGNNQSAVSDILFPFVSEQERQNQALTPPQSPFLAEILRLYNLNPNHDMEYVPHFGPHLTPFPHYTGGGALEIHNYAQTAVSSKPTSDINQDTEHKPLIVAIFDHMSSQIKGNLLSYSEAAKIMNDAIQRHIPSDRQEEAREVAFFRLESDIDYEQQICLVITFLQQEHPESIGLWIHGFVEESINAYSAGNRISCTKGIKERSATGLRGIDKTLDSLFAQAEGPVFIKNFYIPLWNIDSNISQVVQLLKEGGLTTEHTASEAAEIFKQVFTKQLIDYGQSPDSFYDEMTYLAEMIESGYEQIQKEMRK